MGEISIDFIANGTEAAVKPCEPFPDFSFYDPGILGRYSGSRCAKPDEINVFCQESWMLNV